MTDVERRALNDKEKQKEREETQQRLCNGYDYKQ